MPESRQANTVAIPRRWPLVQQFYTRSPNTPITKDARLVNAYAEKDPADGEYWVFKRLGVSPLPYYSNPGFAAGQYTYTGTPGIPLQVLCVTGGYLYVNELIVGAVPGSGLPGGYQTYFETVNSSPQTVVLMNIAWAGIYTPSTGSLVQITDSTFAGLQLVPGWAYLDATLYVMDVYGSIWGTAGFNNAAVWAGLNVIPASTKADQGVFLATQLTYVIAFKQWTTQIFYDAENPAPGSPLSPVPDAQIPFGCLFAASVQKIDEILLWVTSNQTISPQVILMENLSPRIVSTPSIDRLLDNVLAFGGIGVNPVYSWSLKHAGHRFYGLTLIGQNLTIVYDIDQKLWYQWTDSSGNYWPFTNFAYTLPSGLAGQPIPGLHLAQYIGGSLVGPVAGNSYVIDGDYEYPNDIGVLFPVDIYTPNFTGGTSRRKQLNMMYFDSDQTAGSLLNCRYSDDDYAHWTNFRTLDLNYERPYLDQEGTFTKRAYHFRHRCNTTFRIKASDLQLDLGTL